MKNQFTYTDHKDINLNRYFAEIRTFKPLPAEEQQALAKAAQQGDQKARTRLIATNLAYVVTVANSYNNEYIDVKDLIEAGNIGLMMAVDAFDVTRGCAFLTYADHMISKYIRLELANSTLVHIPDNVYREMQLSVEDEENMSLSGTSVAQAKEGQVVYIDAGCDMYDTLEADADYRADYRCEHASEMERLTAALGSLPDKKQRALALMFGLEDGFEHAPEMIAEELHISRERVRQIKEEGLQALAQKYAA